MKYFVLSIRIIIFLGILYTVYKIPYTRAFAFSSNPCVNVVHTANCGFDSNNNGLYCGNNTQCGMSNGDPNVVYTCHITGSGGNGQGTTVGSNSCLPEGCLINFTQGGSVPDACSASVTPIFSPTPTLSPTLTPSPKPTATNTPSPTLSPSPTPSNTPTPTPQDTLINMTIGLDGLGSAGDSLNRNGGNKNPRHPSRSVIVTVLNSVNQSVAQGSGTIQYQTTTGLFTGTVTVGNQLTTGSYFLKISSPGFLPLSIPQPFTIQAGSTFSVSTVFLVNGNINSDTQFDIQDYNELISCYLNQANTPSCLAPITTNSAGADINDDGAVNEFDYNLFVRELSAQ